MGFGFRHPWVCNQCFACCCVTSGKLHNHLEPNSCWCENATGKELRVKFHQTLTPHAYLQASDQPHLHHCSKASHSVVNLSEGQDALSLQARDSAATESLPKLCCRRGVVVFLFLSFGLYSTKHLRSLVKTILVSPCEDVTLYGLPAGPELPSVRLETTKRRRVSAQRRRRSLGVDDPRLTQNKLVVVWVLGQAKLSPST